MGRSSGWVLFGVLALLVEGSFTMTWAARHAPQTGFRAEAIKPGETTSLDLKRLVGKPARMIREGASREFLFYDLGQGSAIDATVCVHKGVVEYVSYLCKDSLRDVLDRFEGERSVKRQVPQAGRGHGGVLSQVLYEGKGRGFLYEPKSQKIKACVAWEPGRKFDSLGR